jgi:hypothetical protein
MKTPEIQLRATIDREIRLKVTKTLTCGDSVKTREMEYAVSNCWVTTDDDLWADRGDAFDLLIEKCQQALSGDAS